MLLIDFYVLQTCACLSFQKIWSSQSSHAQFQYGSELVEYDHSTIYKLDPIKQLQGPDNTIGSLNQYHHNLVLCHLTWCAYQLPIMFFSETCNLPYLEQCSLAILAHQINSLCLLEEIKIILRECFWIIFLFSLHDTNSCVDLLPMTILQEIFLYEKIFCSWQNVCMYQV